MREKISGGEFWFADRITENERHQHKIKRLIVRKKTRFQTLAIVESHSFGRCLIIDDDLQSCEIDEFIYHEALVHPAMILHGNPREVLIMGGGEGATLREVLRYKCVRNATMVDIDSTVLELCKEHMPAYSLGVFDDKRASIIIQDAKRYVEEINRQFDVIVSDLCSPIEGGPAYKLYCQEFYKVLKGKLTERGIFCAQVDSCSLTNIGVTAAIYSTLKTVFPRVELYMCYIPSFDAPWGFLIASEHHDSADLRQEDIDQRVENLVSGKLRFYDGETHYGMFSLPKHIREELSRKRPIITEQNPIFIFK